MRNVTRILTVLALFAVLAFVNGPQVKAQTPILTESFENAGAIPAGWSQTWITGTTGYPLTFITNSTSYPAVTAAYNGSYFVNFYSFLSSTGTQIRLARTTALNTVGKLNIGVDFAWYMDPGYSTSCDNVQVQWSTNGTTWNNAGTPFCRYNATAGWFIKQQDLGAGAAGQATLYVAFLFTSAFGDNCNMDLVHVNALSPPPPTPSPVTIGNGTVTTAYPFYNLYGNAHTQLLYTAAEIAASGGAAGNITQLAFNFSNYVATQLMPGFQISFQNTALTALPTTFVTGGFTTCYGPVTYSVPGTGWQTFNFTTPFAWNGTSNVLVDVCWNDPNALWSTYQYVFGTAGVNNEVGQRQDPPSGCGLTTGTVQTNRANVRLTMPVIVGHLSGVITACYNGAPIAGATVVAGGQSGVTAANGSYLIYNVPIGLQTVVINAPGFLTNTTSTTIVANQLGTLNACLNPASATMTGIVKDAANSMPITGAKVTFVHPPDAPSFTYTTSGGNYSLVIVPAGTGWNVVVSKAGFNDSTLTNQTIPSGTVNMNFSIWQTANPPSLPATATKNAGATAVDIAWGQPTGFYEILYESGIQTAGNAGFTMWATQNNLNGVKFTAPSYPAIVVGGKVNVGKAANYATPPPTRPPFKMYVYDATGPNGTPGAIIATSGDIVPTVNLGWCDFTFTSPVTIPSGNFFIVMKQSGNAPNAYGLAIDTANSQYRSYSQYATGGGPWVPAAGNFMIRAICQGQGGPLHLANKMFINTQPVPGAIYESPLRPSSGYEGDGEVRGYDWANMLNDRSVIADPPATKSSIVATRTDEGQGVTGPFNGQPKELDNSSVVLFNNGPLVNSAGTGTNGADESVIQAPIGSYGWNINTAIPYRCADDFTVVGTSWAVTSFDLYTYQSAAPLTTCPITKAVLRIWNGQPGTSGATVVWGDTVTNRMSAGVYSNINRVSTIGGGNARAIWKITANTPGLTLNPGTYWAEWGFLGSASYSGPWGPPVTINNTPTTGNAIMFAGTLAGWSPIMGVTGPPATNPQGMPFNVNGTTSGGGSIPFLVWRLNQGQEGNTATWTAVPGTPTTQTFISDNSWPSLPDGAYRWAIKASYPGNHLSTPVFTNVLGKNWVTQVTVNITTTCYQIKPAYAAVKLVNTLVPDTMYLKVSDTTGIVVFPAVWKGNYNLSVLRMGFSPFTQNVDIFGPTTINVNLIGEKLPPTGLVVNAKSLHATWHPPRAEKILLVEDWSSVSFATNGWTATGSGNWYVTTGTGNPAPSAEFYYYPTLASGYNEYLTSKTFPATYAPMLNLKYDIYLSNFDPTTSNSMAVEVWNGSTWHAVKTWESSGGNIPWTTDVQNLGAYSNAPFKIQFHAFGNGSYAINNWNIDNISIIASDGHTGPNPCVAGYNFYLNSVLSGFTPDTTYDIPPTQVVYGQTYNACVLAVYGSGYSSQICVSFVSQFLYPPREVAVAQVECSAYITWKKPQIPGELDIMNVRPRTDAPMASTEYSPTVADIKAIAPDNTEALWDVLWVYTCSDGTQAGVETNNQFIYAPVWSGTNYMKYDIATGALLETFTIAGTNGVRDLAYDGSFFYGGANAGSQIYKLDLVNKTLVSTINTGVASIRHIAYDADANGGAGGFWCGGWSDLYLVSMSGTTLATGPAQSGGAYGCQIDKSSNPGHTYLWVHDQLGASADNLVQFEKTNATTVVATGFTKDMAASVAGLAGATAGGLGSAVLNSKFYLVGMSQMTANKVWAVEMGAGQGGGGTPPGLVGYQVFRDDILIHEVPSPDTLYYYDLNVAPGTHKWSVDAKYDLTAYGLTGFGYSLPVGNVSMPIVCGLPLPFYEPWDQASFTFQGWTFEPATQQHWVINTTLGNPLPCADFKWDPPTTYAGGLSLESPTLNAGGYSCASIFFDFDYKCIDRNGGETEKLSAEVLYNGAWHTMLDLKNNGTTANWVPKHVDISTVKGKGFKVRFKASGANSANILHWYVDNINVYAVCNRPLALTGTQKHDTINLSWNAPSCASGEVIDLIFDDGTAETQVFITGGSGGVGNIFPVGPTMTGKIIGFDVYGVSTNGGTAGLTRVNVYDNNKNLIGTSPDFNTVLDGWAHVNVDSIPFTGQFYALTDLTDAGDFNGLGLDQNGPFATSDLTWTYLAPTWSLLSAYGFPQTVAMVRAKVYIPYDLKSAATLAPVTKQTSPPQKPSSRIHVANCKSGTFFGGTQGIYSGNLDGSIVNGYNVYRTDKSGVAPFNKLNSALVTVRSYKDVIGNLVSLYGDYKYFVTASYKDTIANAFLCESPGSDTVAFKWPAVGIVEIGHGQITVYPNPANDNVNVSSDYTINSIDVMNYVGQTVYQNLKVDGKTTRFNVSNLQAGIYFVKVATEQGTRTVKITVTR